MKIKQLLNVGFIFSFILIGIRFAEAHCPLCVVGAATVAGGAVWLGVNEMIIGVFIGAFAVSVGWWISRMIKKKYIPFQKTLIILISFATTIFPILFLFKGFYPLYISIIGEYGSLLNRTYLINLFLIGSVVGGLIVSLTPMISKKISSFREGKIIPYQGTALTLTLLIFMSAIIYIIS